MHRFTSRAPELRVHAQPEPRAVGFEPPDPSFAERQSASSIPWLERLEHVSWQVSSSGPCLSRRRMPLKLPTSVCWKRPKCSEVFHFLAIFSCSGSVFRGYYGASVQTNEISVPLAKRGQIITLFVCSELNCIQCDYYYHAIADCLTNKKSRLYTLQDI